VSTFLFSACSGTEGQSGVAFSADLLVTVSLSGKHLESGFDNTTTKTQDKMES
jgi:hypothetical protein